MEFLWRWLISWLVWLSADPAAITSETPKAAAAVAVAYAACTPAPEPEKKPATPAAPVGTRPGPCPGGVCPVR